MKRQGLATSKAALGHSAAGSASGGGKPVHYVRRDSTLGLVAVISLCLVALVGVSLLFRSTYNDLKERYDGEVEKRIMLQATIDQLSGRLNETSSKLKLKQRVEEDLSEQYVDVVEERDGLQDQVATLESDIAGKQEAIDDLEQENQVLQRKIEKYEECITDDDKLNSNLNVCD